jgi:hypothetical protein
MRKSLKEVIMERDCLSEDVADELIEACRAEMMERLADPATMDEMPFDILEEWFGLEPDYLDDIIEL